jgi:hypothetical protein
MSRAGAPPRWIQLAISAEALQVSAAGKLHDLKGWNRPTLDAAWDGVSEDARTCLRVAAVKSFNVPNAPACRDPKSAVQVFQNLHVPVTQDNAAVMSWALLYYAAKGHSDYADALLSKFETSAP